MSFDEFRSAIFVHVSIMILIPLAYRFPLLFPQMNFRRVNWVLVIDLCIWFLRLLHNVSMMIVGVFMNLITGIRKWRPPILLLRVLTGPSLWILGCYSSTMFLPKSIISILRHIFHCSSSSSLPNWTTSFHLALILIIVLRELRNLEHSFYWDERDLRNYDATQRFLS